jgi:adhesin/invasin
MRSPIRFAALAAAAIVAASCTDSSSATGAAGSGRIALSASFSPSAVTAFNALAQFGLDITNVHLRLTAPDGSTRDSTIAFPATMDVLQIDVAVPLRTAGQSFTADVELRNANDIVLFSGRQIVIAQASTIPGTTPSPIVIDYTGPGRDVKAITLAPASPVISGATTLPFVASAVDAAGAPVSNFLVAWSITDTTLAKVAESGNTGAVVTSAGKRGVVTLSAKTPLGITGSTQVTLVPLAARVVVVSGNGQSGPAGHAVANPLIVEVQASDNLPVPGATVTFRAVTAGASVGTASVVADANGRASTTLVVGQTAGTYQFEATSGSLTPVSATATATPAPAAAIIAVSGSGQTAPISTTLPQPFVVRVTNEFGGVVAGATVTWTRVSGSGTVGSATSTTAADGTASTTYALGTVAGVESIRASLPNVSGSAADFTATATGGAPASLVSAGSGQHAPVGSALPSPLAVRVFDAFGNSVPGATVAWHVTSNSGTTATFAPAVSTTDAAGSATTVVTLGGAPGPVTVVAVVNNLTATYQLTGDVPASTPGGPGVLSGSVFDAQTQAPIGGILVTVRRNGQAVATATTLGTGAYVTAQLQPGNYDVLFTGTGFTPTTITLQTISGNTVAPAVPLVPASTAPGTITGTVRSATDTIPIPAQVELRAGINDTTGTALQVVQAPNGQYSLTNVPAGTYTVVARATSFIDASRTVIAVGGTTTATQDIFLSPFSVPDLVRIVLTWGATPVDLDSYLSGPQQNTTARFFLGYQFGQFPYNSVPPYAYPGDCTAAPFACLDVDDTNGFGPETMTITQVLPGTYRYTVHNFLQDAPLAQSGARVDVYINNLLARTFAVPAGTGIYWTVFDLNGATITPINTIGNGPVTTRIPVGTGISASRIPAPKSVSAPLNDNDLIAEYVRLHPKTKGAPRP